MTDEFSGRASGQGRIYQAAGDLHITEGPQSVEWTGPDSVRHPAAARSPSTLRDRTALMERLREAVAPGRGGDVFVLHGMGGCGKTAVAQALFQQAVVQAGRVGLWVNSSDQVTLRSGMLSVAADRGASDGELVAARNGLRATADLVWNYLDRSSEPWLLVLDNADAPAILREGGWLRTSPKGTVLVTTRQAGAEWWPAAELMHVDVLPRDAAAQVLQDLAPGTGTKEEAAAVADRLGRLPLALTLAGGFLSHQIIVPWTLRDYDERLQRPHDQDPVQLLDRGAGIDTSDARLLVSRTWQLSLDSLVRQGVPEAVNLLRLLACGSDAPLPLSVLGSADLGPDLPRHRVETALRSLLDNSLTSLVRDSLPRAIRTHGVLLESVARATPQEQHEKLASASARLLLNVLPEVPHRGQVDAATEMLAPHALALLRRVSRWNGLTGETADAVVECVLRTVVAIHRLGDYSSALTLATQAVDLVTPLLGQDHKAVLQLRQRVGRAVYRLGRYEEAEAIHRGTLADAERVLGPDDPVTWEGRLALSHPLWVQGKTQESVTQTRQALAGLTGALGTRHPKTLIARMYLLELQPGPELDHEVEQGDTLVSDCLEALGPDHPVTLAAQVNYGYALFYTGHERAALPHVKSALAGFERTCGPDYPITLAARDMLASVLNSMGKVEKAREHLTTVIEKRARLLGADHPFTQGSMERLSRFGEREDGPGRPG